MGMSSVSITKKNRRHFSIAQNIKFLRALCDSAVNPPTHKDTLRRNATYKLAALWLTVVTQILRVCRSNRGVDETGTRLMQFASRVCRLIWALTCKQLCPKKANQADLFSLAGLIM